MDLRNIIKKFEIKVLESQNFNFLNLLLSKLLFFNIRISNYLLNLYEWKINKDCLLSYPTILYLNTTNSCNLRCKFCEIHYFYNFANEKAGKVFPNNITIDLVEKYRDLFKRSIFLELSGACGEPLLNPYFVQICKIFKEDGINLIITTNGTLLNQKIVADLVDMRFNAISISLHSGEEKNYHNLQGGDYNKVLKNIENLIKTKKRRGSNLPKVYINCLVFKLNQHTLKNLIKMMKQIGVDKINFYHYYASRNKINGDVSFYLNPEEGNLLLENIYQYANSINQKLGPAKPNFININRSINDNKKIIVCRNPWTSLKFIGCVEYKDSHYISICNRIILFRLNYEEFIGNFIEDIWNHEIIRYFRKMIMKNPICQFCRNSNTPKLRCLNNKQYQIERDKAIKRFLANAINSTYIKPRKGIYLLDENPYKYVNYYEKS